MTEPLHSELGQLVISQRPRTALSVADKGGGSGQTWIHTDRGPGLVTEEVAPMIHRRLPNIRSALKAVDPGGTGLVSKEDFRQVLKSMTGFGQTQLDTVLGEVCDGPAVDYLHFLRRFSRGPVATRASSSSGGGRSGRSSDVRRGLRNTSMSLPEIQKHLRHKIGGNLRTVIRAFRLFDHDREGHIEQHEFRRIMDNYCIQLTNREFQRLWHHYSPNNPNKISYELFLDQLGFGDGHNFKIAPVCTKLAVSSPGTGPCGKVHQKKPRTESQLCSRAAPSASFRGNLPTLFHDKMCVNAVPVWQALQAFDTTRSGLVTREALRAVLSNFLFPMDLRSFQKLTSCYGVRATGPVRWKHFLGRFVSPGEEDVDSEPHTDRSCEPTAPDSDDSDFQDIYPRLKEIFHLLNAKEGGGITRADLRYLLGRSVGTLPRIPLHCLQHSRITGLCNVLDPEHTGVIQLASLEKLNPSNAAPPSTPDNAAKPHGISEGAKDSTTESEEPTADERETTQWADRVSVASASWRTLESPLPDNLCGRLTSLLAALQRCDPQHTGYIPQEDLRKVLSTCGVPVTDTHFNRLCESFSSTAGSSSTLVSYNDLLKNLQVPAAEGRNTLSSRGDGCHAERTCTPQSTLQPILGQQSPTSSQVGTEACYILDIVFNKMRSRLEQLHASLTDRIQAIIPNCDAVDLSETDLRKILEDSWVVLDEENFDEFAKCLGVTDGRIRRSAFRAKYEEATGRAGGRPGSESGVPGKQKVGPLPTAEQCLAELKSRITVRHGNSLTAFRLMDRKCKGVVDRHDFKVLYDSLGFVCGEAEYERLLDLIGLRPGANLNYAEFADAVENEGKRAARTPDVRQQLHELLASEARYKWADMSKVLCQSGTDGQSRVDKKRLRGLLFTYALPMAPTEFDQLWTSYDPEGRGSVPVCDFLEKLGFHHEGKLRSRSQRLNRVAARPDADQPDSADAASLECIRRILQHNSKDVSDALTDLDTRGDGSVAVEDLLSLLHSYSCCVSREQLVDHLHRLRVSLCDDSTRLPYVDFLSAFEQKADMKSQPPPTPDAVQQIESLDALGSDAALAKMRDRVASSAPNLYKTFSAFDQGGTGTIKALEFRRVLESFCARPTDKQYRHLLTKLELDCEKSTVNWKDFLNRFQLDIPLTPDGTLSGSGDGEPEVTSPVHAETSGKPEPRQQILDAVSGDLKTTKELMDLDTSKTASKEHFRQLCERHCPSLTNHQFECAWRQMPVHEQKNFEKHGRTLPAKAESLYNGEPSSSPVHRDTHSATDPRCPTPASAASLRTTFCSSRSNLPRCSAAQGSSRRPSSVGRPGAGSPPGGTERRLRGAMRRCWKEIQRQCAAEDSQRDGHISTGSFLGILQSLNVSVTQEQLHDLAAKFGFMNNGCVVYHDFLRHFLLNLDPTETTKAFERLKLPLPITPASRGVLSRDCVEVMLRAYDVVRSSWTSIRRGFLASDGARTGSVSVQDFRKVLSRFRVNLSEDEFFHLCSYFDAQTTGRICYNNFLWAFLH